MTNGSAEDAPDGMRWVPTSRGTFGELEDWRLVPTDVAGEWDVRVWNPLP